MVYGGKEIERERVGKVVNWKPFFFFLNPIRASCLFVLFALDFRVKTWRRRERVYILGAEKCLRERGEGGEFDEMDLTVDD